MSVILKTAEECLAKAEAMERLAAETTTPAWRADLRFMAKCWRDVAFQARWQDAPPPR
jgi:hypothetical protein